MTEGTVIAHTNPPPAPTLPPLVQVYEFPPKIGVTALPVVNPVPVRLSVVPTGPLAGLNVRAAIVSSRRAGSPAWPAIALVAEGFATPIADGAPLARASPGWEEFPVAKPLAGTRRTDASNRRPRKTEIVTEVTPRRRRVGVCRRSMSKCSTAIMSNYGPLQVPVVAFCPYELTRLRRSSQVSRAHSVPFSRVSLRGRLFKLGDDGHGGFYK